ncbi:MAG TPA: RNA-guided endonuclease IscB [Spirochaetia bacterium]|nr:RNA-guided endonuclease IscB [Spirochaetia bacterium]
MVYVLDKRKKPLMPCSEKRARLLLEHGRAVVHKMAPFTIRLKDRLVEDSVLQPLDMKLDPGSKVTGGAVVRDGKVTIGCYECRHRTDIKGNLDARREQRRSRRNRKTRYREPRFNNRHPEKCAACGRNAKHGSRYCRPCHEAGRFVDNGLREAWLPPSLRARVEETLSWVCKMRQLLPITAIAMELIRFDTQLMENPDISGVEYQQGTLAGYEVREYLLQKFARLCAYCRGASGDPVLNVEHVVPRNPDHGPKGTDRVSNLVIACKKCNDDKGNLQPEEWLEQLRASGKALDQIRTDNLPKALQELKQPLKDAAMMNATRWGLYRRLTALALPLETGSGGLTKYNRTQVLKLPKTHYYDAACVGKNLPETVAVSFVEVYTATGRGNRQMAGIDKYGFPYRWRERKKTHCGFKTGDLVAADIPKGKYTGSWRGRVAVRKSGYFDIKEGTGKRICQGIPVKYCRLRQRANGWQHERMPADAGAAIPPHG